LAESDGGLDWLTKSEPVEGAIGDEPARDGYQGFFEGVGALAMGSGTYEFILDEASEGWPYEGTPSWVFSSRELEVPFDADIRLASGPVRPVCEEMKAAAGGRNVWIVGGGNLAMQFADEGLLDELHLTIIPVVLGDGLPTFPRRLRQRLRLTSARPYRGGVVGLRFDFLP
jgi:dihydrofolate reductase